MNIYNLNPVQYSATGNRTPVVQINDMINNVLEPGEIRTILENDTSFRKLLQKCGIDTNADSVMIYYRATAMDYDYVMFVGEPNAPLVSKFSEMCGNGIRSLALHIALTENNPTSRLHYLQYGIRIWTPAGIMRVKINSMNIHQQSAKITVPLGPFHLEMVTKEFGIGFNGIRTGEPHLVHFMNNEEIDILSKKHNIAYSQKNPLHALREIAFIVGNHLTFSSKYPLGINVNIAHVTDEHIYIATHERNLALNQNICAQTATKNGVCSCVTQACGTGGSATANLAVTLGLVMNKEVHTIHSGGEITYIIEENQTYMIGLASRVTKNYEKNKNMDYSISAQ